MDLQEAMANIKLDKSRNGTALGTKPKCSICGDTGIKQVYNKDGSYTECACDCFYEQMKAEKLQRNLEKAGFNGLFKDKDFSNYLTENNYQANLKAKCKDFINQDKAIALCLLGNVGCGKTHLAVSVLKELAKKGREVKAIGYVELTRQLSGNAMDLEAYNRIMSNIKNVQVLLIDDLFKAKASEANLRQIYEIINYRYSNQKVTIVTSEHNMADLTNVDEAIATRLVEMADREFVLNITRIGNHRYQGMTKAGGY